MSPVLVAPDRGPWRLHGREASRRVEAQALAASAPQALMQRAGLGVARLALALAPQARHLLVLAGPGNNGGDGLVAASHLLQAGKAVRVVLLADASRQPVDAAWALQQARETGVPLATALDDAPCDLVIDALLGLGSQRAPDGAIADAIRHANAHAAPVLAVDLPSGLHADTGQPLGDDVVHARATLSLLTLKPGLFTGQGRDAAGDVWLDTLGIAAPDASAQLAGAPPVATRRHASHKGSYGDVAVVGGAPGMAGAAWLAARAALAAGAGRVFCSPLDERAALLDPVQPELMGRRRWWTARPEVLAATTVLAGCGGGAPVRETLPALLGHAGRLVLDADALNAIAGDSGLQALLRARSARARPTVLTPHPLEAARLLGGTAAAVQADRLAAAQRLSALFACTVVLKGSGSVISEPGECPSINPTGNALLASAGTGDVLAGWLAGVWAQGGSARDAALSAAWQHGRAADRAAAAGQRRPLRAGELIERMRGV